MNLTDALATARVSLTGKCMVPPARAALPEADRAVFDVAMADRGVPSVQVAVALDLVGVRISSTDITDHRVGNCPCILTGA